MIPAVTINYPSRYVLHGAVLWSCCSTHSPKPASSSSHDQPIVPSRSDLHTKVQWQMGGVAKPELMHSAHACDSCAMRMQPAAGKRFRSSPTGERFIFLSVGKSKCFSTTSWPHVQIRMNGVTCSLSHRLRLRMCCRVPDCNLEVAKRYGGLKVIRRPSFRAWLAKSGNL